MQVTYAVNSVQRGPLPANATVGDITTQVMADGMTVELVNDAFSHTFRFTDPAQIAEAGAWSVGQTITLTLTGEPL